MPHSLLQFPFLLPFIFVIIWLRLCWSGARSLLATEKAAVTRLSEAESRAILTELLSQDIADPEWLKDAAFQPVGVFRQSLRPNEVVMVVWQRKPERTYLTFYRILGQFRVMDIETMFDGDGGLATLNVPDGHIFPAQCGYWKQCFQISNLSELCRLHDEGLDFLAQRTSAQPSKATIKIEDEIKNGVEKKCAFVRSIPFWFLRIPYWYFLRRRRLFGKSVREQYQTEIT